MNLRISTFCLLLLVAAFFSSECRSQAFALKLEKIKKGVSKKSQLFFEGETLIIQTKEARYKGIFAMKDTNSLILNGGEIIQLTDIEKLRKPNGKLLGGIAFTTMGTALLWGGLFAMGVEDVFDSDSNSNAEIASITGFLTLTAGTQMLSKYNYKPYKRNWRLSIVQL